MKLTAVMLLAIGLQVSAGGFAQNVTLTEKNAPLVKIFREIKKQTGYNFLYSSEVLKQARNVDIDVRNAPLSAVLSVCFTNQPLTWEIEEKTILVKPATPTPLKPQTPPIDVKGRVIDQEGKPVFGATIQVKGNKLKGTTSNEAGEFTLLNVDDKTTLVISGISIETFEVRVNGRTDLAQLVALPKITTIEEVQVTVNTGYQTITRERSAGSYTKANMDVVANRSTSMNVLQSLDGLVPGLVVNNAPNRNQFIIRGLSTTGSPSPTGNTNFVTTNRSPLFVVDGLVMQNFDAGSTNPLGNINPQDVESIVVLKDATAASIWGARAANGVIVITTKKGSFNSKLRVNYDGFVNFRGKPDLNYVPMLNSRQFVDAATEIFNMTGGLKDMNWNSASGFPSSLQDLSPHEKILFDRSRGVISEATATARLDSLAGIDNRAQIKDLLYRNALLTNHTLSLSGGSDKYSFYGSMSYTNTQSNDPGDKDQNFKINFRQDIRAAKFARFHIITDLLNTVSSAKRPLTLRPDYYPYQLLRDANGNNLSIPFMTGLSDSVLAAFSARARTSLDYNPMNEYDRGYTKYDNVIARVNGGVDIDIFKGLRFEGKYGFIKGMSKTRDFESLQSYTVRKEIVNFAVAATPATVPTYYLPTNGGRLSTNTGDQRNYTIRNQLVFDNTFGKHQILAMAGQEAQEQFSTTVRTRVRGFDEDLLTSQAVDYKTVGGFVMNTVWPNYVNVASTLGYDNFGTTEVTSRFTSYYANAGYTYDRRYTLNASWRIDQSNLFGKDKAAQNKPVWSVGGKWNASSESFMKGVSAVQRLALRLTYGITGNSPDVGTAASEDVTSPSGSAFFPNNVGLGISTPGNPQLSWESTATTNLGIDFSILNDRLNASIDLYNKQTTNLLGLIFPNSLNGWPAILGNQGDIRNRGIEVNLQSFNVRTKYFSWTTSLVFAYNKNKLQKFLLAAPITTAALQVDQVFKQGLPAYTLFAYDYAGLDATGAPQIRLADGKISAAPGAKPEDLLYMGSLQPIWNGGITNTLQYKNFRLMANIVYNMGHVTRRDRFLLYTGGELNTNVHVDFLNRWKQPGDEAKTDIPAYLTTASTRDLFYFTKGSSNVIDASFVKMRDITLFYDLPRNVVSKIYSQGVTFRVQVSNLLLWKANDHGIDPEFMDLAPANQKTITVGAHLSF